MTLLDEDGEEGEMEDPFFPGSYEELGVMNQHSYMSCRFYTLSSIPIIAHKISNGMHNSRQSR